MAASGYRRRFLISKAVKSQIEIDVADVLLEVPLEFSIGRRRFYLYPLTLGKSFIVERLLDRVGLSRLGGERLPNFLLLATVSNHREDFIRLIAYYTLPGDGCLDTAKVNRRMRELRKIKDHQAAALVSVILTQDRVSAIMRHFRFDEERKRLERVNKVKKADGNNLVFGGRTVWGSLIDFVAERYGWPLKYILWEVSSANLTLLMEDHVRSVYLTDDELKRTGLPKDNVFIKADDPGALEKFISTRSWR